MKMIPGAMVTRHVGPTGLNFGKETKWYVTHVEDLSGYMYLQQSDSSISVKYERLSQDIETSIGTGKLPCFTSSPRIGTLCIARYTEDELWYRGQILSVDEDDNAELLFIDYGNGEVQPWNGLRIIPEEFTLLPPQAIQCRLANVDPVGGVWSKKAIKLLKELVLERELVGVPTHLCKTGAVVVKLFGDAEKTVVIAQQLVMAGFAHWKKVKSSVSQSSSSTSSSVSSSLSVQAKPDGLGEICLKVGSHYDLCISHIESLNSFYCQPLQYRDSFRQMDDEIQQFYNSSQQGSLTNVIVGQLCCAKFSEDERWHRGTIKQMFGGNKCEVFSVDFGNKEALPLSQIRELVAKFHSLPAIGIHSSLHGIKPVSQDGTFDEEIVRKFMEMTMDKDLVALVKTIEDSKKVLLMIYDTTETRDGVNINKALGKLSNVVLEKDVEESSLRSVSSQSHGLSSVQPHFVGINLSQGDSEIGYVAFATSPFDFSCQFAKNLTSLDTIMNDLNNEYTSLKPGQQKLQRLQPGTPCCARYSEDGRFYRAELIETVGLNAKIHFVDYGNDEQCRADELKHLKKEYLKLPKQAFKCKLTGIELPAGTTFSLDACKRFNDMVIDKEFNISIIKVDSTGHAEVSLVENNESNVARFDASEVLIESGLVSKARSGLQGAPGPTVTNKEFSEVDIPIGDYFDVMPTSIMSPSQFCCQLFEKSGEIDEMMAGLETAYKDSQAPRDMQLRNGMPCVALYPADNLWYRAVLLRTVGPQVDVNYVDYGNEERIPRDNIRPMYAKFMALPAQAFVCALGGVRPKGSKEWSKACVEEFSNMVIEKQLIVSIKHKDKSNIHHIELLDTLSNRGKQISIGEVLVEKGFAEAAGHTQGATSRVERPAKASSSNIPLASVKDEEDIEITFVNNPLSFFCQQTSVAGKVDVLMGNLEDAYSVIGANDLRVTSANQGKACAAKFSEDGAWYRAKVVNVINTAKVEVQYIDYGNCEVVSANDLKELKEEFLEDPAYGLPCALEGVSPKSGDWDAASSNRFKALLDYKVLRAKFHTKQPPYRVSLFEAGKSIAETVVSQGIAAVSQPSRGYKNCALKVGAVEKVYVAHVDDMRNIYCQLVRTENDLYTLMDEIATKINTLPKLSSAAKGKPVCAMFSEDSGWYRGEIEDATGNAAARVRFVDYGNFEEVKAASMRELPGDLLEQPKHAVLCSLDDGSLRWKENAPDLLLQAVADKVISMAVKAQQGGKYLVELRDASGAALTSNLAAPRVSSAGPQTNAHQPPKAAASGSRLPPPAPRTRVEMEFYVTHVDSLSEIYIQESSDAVKIDELMQKLEVIPKQKGGFQTVEPGFPCIAFFSEDEAPYRAVVEKRSGSSALVRFVDYGNAEEKSIAELCPLPQEMLSAPPFSTKCALKDARAPISQSDLERFRNSVFDKELKGKLESTAAGAFQLTVADETICKQFCSTPNASQSSFADVKVTPGSSMDCYISHIEALTEFYVQPCHLEADLDLVATQVAKANSFPRLSQPAARGQICCANFAEDSQWYRGEVVDVAGGKIKVRFIDYGNSDFVDKTNIVSVPAELLKTPRLAIPCSFSGVQQSTDDDIEKFASASLDNIVSVEFQGKDAAERNTVKISVGGKELAFGRAAKNPGLKAETREAAMPGSYSNQQSPAVIVEFNDKMLSNGAEAKAFVSYVVTAQEFYCHLSEDAGRLDDVMEKLQQYAVASSTKALVSYVPGVPCVAMYSSDGAWYRAALECLESQTHAKVKFVDYGNVDSVKIADLKELSGDLLEEPAFAVRCTLLGDVGPSTDFENRVMDKELSLKVTGRQGATYIVDLVSDGKSIAQELSNQQASSKPASTASANVKVYKKPEMKVGEKYDAYFLDGTSPSKFYCHLAKDEKEFEALMNSIYERSGALPVLRPVAKGMCCVGLFSEDACWYRGEVLETRQGEARLFFVDYGNDEWVKNESIKEIPADMLLLPRQAVECSLATAVPQAGAWNTEENKKFKDACADKTFSVELVSFQNETHTVVLKDKSTGKSVNDLFGKTEAAPRKPSGSSASAAPSFPELTLKRGAKFEALGTFVKPTGEVCCQLVEYEGPLGSLMDEIYVHCDGAAEKVPKPVLGQACLALFADDDSWYRGKIMTVGNGEVTVKFVDFGNEAVVPVNDIRQARPVDCELSVTCLDCTIPGIPVNAEVISFLEEKCVNAILIVEVTDDVKGPSAVANITFSETGESVKDMVLKKFPTSQDSSQKSTAPAKKFTYSKIDFDVDAKETMLCSFVRSLDTLEAHVLRHSEEFDEMMDKIALHCGSSDKPMSAPFVGQCCLGNYHVDGGWYRAVILSTSSDNAKLRFVDYGNEDEVSFAHIRETTEEFMRLPALGISCRLHDVHQEDLDVAAGKQWLEESCLNNEYCFKFITKQDENGYYEVNMCYPGGEETVNDELYSKFALEEMPASTEETTAGSLKVEPVEPLASEKSARICDEEKMAARFKEMDLDLSSKTGAFCCFVNDDLQVICQPSSVQEQLDELMVHISHYCAEVTGPPQTIETGMACFAQFADDDEWYRAEIVKLDGDDVNVLYVDYGNKGVVTKGQIRPITEPFLGLPKASFACVLEGQASFSQQSQPIKAFLEEKLLENTVEVSFIKKLGAGVYTAKLFVVGKDVNELVQKGFAGTDLTESGSQKLNTAREESDEKISQEANRFLDPSVALKTTESAVCTHIDSLHQIYVQLTKYQGDLDVVSERMQAYCNGTGGSNVEPVIGSGCMARYTEDELWYRSVITGVRDNTVEVFFVDYGNTDVVSLDATRALTGDFRGIPRTLIKCSLHNVHDEDLDVNAAVAWLQESVLEQEVNVEVVDVVDACYDCILSKPNAEGTVNDELYALFESDLNVDAVENSQPSQTAIAQADQAKDQPPCAPGDDVTSVAIAKFSKPDLNEGSKEEMFCVHAESLQDLYCQFSRFQHDLDVLSEEITKFCEGTLDRPVNFEVGMACLAKFSEDGVWYRAEVIEVLDNDVEVHFVDYGNKDKVPKENTRVIGGEFLRIPATAMKCALHNVHNEDLDVNAAVHWLHNDLIGHEVTVEVVSHSDSLYDCILFKPGAEHSLNDELYSHFALEIEGTPVEVNDAETNAEKVEGDSEAQATSADDKIRAVENTSLRFAVPNLELGAREVVRPVNVESVDRIKCYLSSFLSDLESLRPKMKEFCENTVCDVSNLETGLACLAKFDEDGAWSRAEIKSLEDSCVSVYFVDHEKEGKVKNEDIRAASGQFTSLPVTFITCQFHDVFEADIDLENASGWLHENMVDHDLTVEIVGKVGDVYDCVFYKEGIEGTVNDLLYEQFELQYQGEAAKEPKDETNEDVVPESKDEPTAAELDVDAKEFVPTASSGKTLLTQVESREIEPDSSLLLHLSHPESPSLFWCQFDDTSGQLIELMDSIRSRYFDGDHGMLQKVPEVGTFCSAQFPADNEWYRGEVIDVCDEQRCLVSFIDYGNVEVVQLQNIRLLDSEFYSLPRQAVQCCLHGVKATDSDWSEESIDELADICGDKLLEVDVLHNEDGLLNVIVRAPGLDMSVNEMMINRGFGVKDVVRTNGTS